MTGAAVLAQRVQQGVVGAGQRLLAGRLRAGRVVRSQLPLLVLVQRVDPAAPGRGAAEVGVQQEVRGHRGDAGRARDVVQQHGVRFLGVAGRVHHDDDLGATGGQFHPRGVRPAGQGAGQGLCRGRGGGEPHQPLGLPGPPRVEEPDHAQPAGGAQPLVATGHGLRGHAEDRADPAERRAPVQVQGVHQAAVEVVELVWHVRNPH